MTTYINDTHRPAPYAWGWFGYKARVKLVKRWPCGNGNYVEVGETGTVVDSHVLRGGYGYSIALDHSTDALGGTQTEVIRADYLDVIGSKNHDKAEK